MAGRGWKMKGQGYGGSLEEMFFVFFLFLSVALDTISYLFFLSQDLMILPGMPFPCGGVNALLVAADPID